MPVAAYLDALAAALDAFEQQHSALLAAVYPRSVEVEVQEALDRERAATLAQLTDRARDALEPPLMAIWGRLETVKREEYTLSAEGQAWQELMSLEGLLAEARAALEQSSLHAAWLGFSVDQARALIERLRRRSGKAEEPIRDILRLYEEGSPELRYTFQDHGPALIRGDSPEAIAFLQRLAHERSARLDRHPAIQEAEHERQTLAHTLLDAYRQTRRAVNLLADDTITRRSYLANVIRGILIECYFLENDKVAVTFARRAFGLSWFHGKGAPVQPVPAPIVIEGSALRGPGYIPGITYHQSGT